MSKEEFLKIQKCVLKVNIHCDGCKNKVKKILQKIDGVFTTEIDAEQGRVTVSGNVDPNVLIKKLSKSGKHAELWGAPKGNNNNNIANQLKNMQIDNGNSGVNNKGQNQKGAINQPKGNQQGQNPQQQQLQLQQQQQLQQQLQQLQQMKGFQDLKLLPQFKDMKLPNQNPNAKAVKFSLPEDDLSDDDIDDLDEDYDDEFDDDDDEMDDPQHPLNKTMKPPMGNGAHMMLNGMGMMNQKGGNGGGGNGKKGGGGGGSGHVPVQVHNLGGGHDGKNGNGGKKGGGGGGGGNNQNQGGGNKNNGGKNGGGMGMPEGKSGNKNSGGNGGGGGIPNNNGNGGKKGNVMDSGVQAVNNGFPNMGGGHNPTMAGPNVGPMGGNMSIPVANMQMNQMGNIPAVQGLPAATVNGGGGGGYFQGGGGPDMMAGNPYQQQQYMAAMMNQQRAMGNDRFQPMMYARPPMAVNYMYPPPYSYPPPPPQEPYSNFFSDENTSSCSVM
ncbi:heavy metal-associated isoprenylated plant protein 33-like [Abrus precatorius]|uniref:Heavy metal-associated isoprenylated plant protein 33-like n=1 Tax=Abrus precatorius TaxID=3816 RepID=A0A8B8JQ42_ABRPR|nr:heavy metal-associated isoprenylated plant protein 33-like [Abrus precatorius]